MQVKIKKYSDHFGLSYKIARLFRPIIGEDRVYALLEKIEKIPGYDYGESLNGMYNNWKESKRINVKIDRWDTYSMDSTLTYIILPMLKQLRSELNGAPFTDFEDADAEFHPSIEDLERKKVQPGWTDPNFYKRWENIIDKMIEAFEIHQRDDVLFQNDADRVKRDEGLRLFSKYYINLWT